LLHYFIYVVAKDFDISTNFYIGN